MAEAITCRQPTHRPYTEGGMTFKDRQVVCDAPVEKTTVKAVQCSNCGQFGGGHYGMDCVKAPQVPVTQTGYRCSDGHWQPIEG